MADVEKAAFGGSAEDMHSVAESIFPAKCLTLCGRVPLILAAYEYGQDSRATAEALVAVSMQCPSADREAARELQQAMETEQ